MTVSAVSRDRAELRNLQRHVRVAERTACVALVAETSIESKIALSREIWILDQVVVLLEARIQRLTTMPSLSGSVVEHESGIGYELLLTSLKTAYPAIQRRILALQASRDAAGASETVETLERCAVLAAALPSHPADCVEWSLYEASVRRVERIDIPARPGRPEWAVIVEDIVRPTELAERLHDFAFRIELSAAEACAATIATSPQAPIELHRDLALQLRDEIRHFEIFMTRLKEMGTDITRFPIRFGVWDRFRTASELPDQLIIEQRIGEGAALDTAESFYSVLVDSNEPELAAAYEFVIADEVQHVRNANCWLTVLLGSSDAVIAAEQRARAALVARGFAFPAKPLNYPLRSAAGFRDVDIAELERERAADQSG